MSVVRDNGGPAFPRTIQHWNDRMEPKDGMSLRDWFAGQWVAAGHHSNLRPSEAAEQAYEFADAMLAAREGKS